jgi:hypothetical protein
MLYQTREANSFSAVVPNADFSFVRWGTFVLLGVLAFYSEFLLW